MREKIFYASLFLVCWMLILFGRNLINKTIGDWLIVIAMYISAIGFGAELGSILAIIKSKATMDDEANSPR